MTNVIFYLESSLFLIPCLSSFLSSINIRETTHVVEVTDIIFSQCGLVSSFLHLIIINVSQVSEQ